MKLRFLSSGITLSLIAFMMVSCSMQQDDLLLSARTEIMKSAKADYTLSPMEALGKELYFDKISEPNNMSCADCHAERTGFAGPVAGFNIKSGVYPGAVATAFGNRKPPTASYASFSPIFHFDEEEGLFVGGNFWDGRATGERLGSPTAEQAIGPFLNPVEHNVASAKDVLMKIMDEKYMPLWEEVWGEPIMIETEEQVNLNYDRVGLSIAAFEASEEVNQFSSKFDYVMQGLVEFTPQEAWGMELFNSEEKGKCSLCHISEPLDDGTPALFTDFTFDNLGTPKNPDNPMYESDPDWVDPGLGGFLMTRFEWASMADENWGKHKVPTLRNVGKAPGGAAFPKAYMHNGVFKSLKEVVHFYNTRDVEMWPEPEVSQNVNDEELGNLMLSEIEEDAIVAFMLTLSDGYKLK